MTHSHFSCSIAANNVLIGEDCVDDESTIDLREILFVIRSKWRMILLFALIAAITAFCVTKYFIKPQYKATSMLYVLGKSSGTSDGINLQLSQQVTVDFQILATSRPVVEAVISDCSLSQTYEQLIKKIAVSNPTDTNILKMTVTDENPQQAADIANALSKETENQIEQVMVTEKMSSVEDAVAPTTPSSSSPARNSMLAGIIVFCLAAAIAIFRYFSDDTIKTEEDIKKYLGLPILAVFPVDEDIIKKKSARRRRKAKKK